MDQHWDFGMGEHLDCLAAEDDRRDTVAAMRGYDYEIAAFRLRGIDDRLIGMLMLGLDRVACDSRRFRRRCHGAQDFLGIVLHADFVLRRSVLEHSRVGRQHMKRRQDRQRGDLGADPLGELEAVLDGLSGELRPVRRYQDGVYIVLPLIPGLLRRRGQNLIS